MTDPHRGTRPVRIANCSGFYGDRLSAAREMVDGGPIDVLTGDWLAELTMLILARARQRDERGGYARTFITQMSDVLADCLDRGIRVVTNAGGLDPAGCAEAVRRAVARPGAAPKVAYVEGDDLLTRFDEVRDDIRHLVDDSPFTDHPVSANAYLGARGIARALASGADVVVCGRVTDAALVVGPAMWWWDWQHDDLDRLAGAVVAGHVIECGAQATGGNYAFFDEIPDLSRPIGFPIAEIADDGSCVITKHPDTGGLVSTGTVTAQLLYEIGDERYANPDVVTRFDTIRLADDGPDRVRVFGTRGEPPPSSLKVSINVAGGFRNRMSFVLTGLDQERKADWVLEQLEQRLGGRHQFDLFEARFVPAPADGDDQERSSGTLHVHVQSTDEQLVGRAFSSAATELALAGYPGFFTTTPPGGAQSFGVFWPGRIDARLVHETIVHHDGRREVLPAGPGTGASAPHIEPVSVPATEPIGPPDGAPLGTLFGARSGDKGGDANLGVWARDDAGFVWLVEHLTPEVLHDLLPETVGHEIRRSVLPGLRAVNFVIVGLLGRGVAASTAFDPQAKGLGEYFRSRRWTASLLR
jgi:hypothetical protein